MDERRGREGTAGAASLSVESSILAAADIMISEGAITEQGVVIRKDKGCRGRLFVSYAYFLFFIYAVLFLLSNAI